MINTIEIPQEQAENQGYVVKIPTPKDWQLKLFPESGKSDWGIQTECPACGIENVHFSFPGFKQTDDYEAWEGRGDALRIPMWCENGHTWTLRLGFHKGYTFADLESLQEVVHPTEEALALLPKYKYNPATRYATAAGRNRVTEAQLRFMQSLRTKNRLRYDALVKMMLEFWSIEKVEYLRGADAGHIIKMMQL